MKRLALGRVLVSFIFFVPPQFLGGTDTPPYTISETEYNVTHLGEPIKPKNLAPAINENFNEAFRIMDTHKHSGTDDSSRLFDVIPSSPSVYDLGSSTNPWQNAIVSTSVVLSTLFSKTTLLIDGNPKLMPSYLGQIVLSSGTYDLWVATGLGDSASWKVFRSTENRKY